LVYEALEVICSYKEKKENMVAIMGAIYGTRQGTRLFYTNTTERT